MLYLIGGVERSGKSTLAQKILERNNKKYQQKYFDMASDYLNQIQKILSFLN